MLMMTHHIKENSIYFPLLCSRHSAPTNISFALAIMASEGFFIYLLLDFSIKLIIYYLSTFLYSQSILI